MDVTTVAITLGTSFFVMVTGVAVSLGVPYIQTKKDLERRARQRRREVTSEPLIRLRGVVADTAKEWSMYLTSARLSKDNPQSEKAAQNATEAQKKLAAFLREGVWLRTVYTVPYPEIQSEFKKTWDNWLEMQVLLLKSEKDPSQIDTDKLHKLDEEMEATILKIQSLINKRLEE